MKLIMNFKLKEFEQFAVVLKGCGRPLKTRQNFGQKPYKICKKNTENFKYQNIKWKYFQRTMMKKKLRRLLDEEERFENFRFRRIAADEPLKRSRLHRLNHQVWSGMKRKKERKKIRLTKTSKKYRSSQIPLASRVFTISHFQMDLQ